MSNGLKDFLFRCLCKIIFPNKHFFNVFFQPKMCLLGFGHTPNYILPLIDQYYGYKTGNMVVFTLCSVANIIGFCAKNDEFWSKVNDNLIRTFIGYILLILLVCMYMLILLVCIIFQLFFRYENLHKNNFLYSYQK